MPQPVHRNHSFAAQSLSLALASLLAMSCNSSTSGPDTDQTENSSSGMALNSSGSVTPSSGGTASSSSAAQNAVSSSSLFSWGDFCWPGSECDISSSSSTPAVTSSGSSASAGEIIGNKMWDQRDGSLYDLSTIAGRLWTSNMNYQTNDGSSCYFDSTDKKSDPDKNCADYGRLYTYSAALEACPGGWHLPTATEVRSALKDGMTISYGGREKGGHGNFLGQMGFMWTASTTGVVETDNCGNLPSGSCAVLLVEQNPEYDSKGQFLQLDSRYKGFSVRCVQN